MTRAVQCRGVTKVYGNGFRALAGVDLTVGAGQCFAILGANGAGKTTTIEIIEGLIPATSGEVTVLGRTWTRHARELRSRVGVALQGTRLPDKLTVLETVGLFASFYARPLRPETVLDDLGMTPCAHRRVAVLSEGQRQRLSLACAMIGNPELLSLDEPTAGLDPNSRLQFWAVLQRHRDSGRTIIFTTHHMEEAERLCDRLAIMDGGCVIASGTPGELKGRLGGGFVIELSLSPASVARVPERAFDAVPGVASVRHFNNSSRLIVKDAGEAVTAVSECARSLGVGPVQLSTRQATLEDVFVELTGKCYGPG